MQKGRILKEGSFWRQFLLTKGMGNFFSATGTTAGMLFGLALVLLGLLALGLFVYARRSSSSTGGSDDQLGMAEFLGFQRTYLLVYSLAVAGDWLQGPHVYALYQFYWMSKHQIELLFIAGFGSSLFFGTFVGSIADKFGRKANCLLYALLYGIGCLTKHFGDFRVLLFGRLMGGISTSILFSAFESWLIFEHKKRKFSDHSLKQIFANATLANSLIAILAGLVAQGAANIFGYVAPFDCAFAVLMLMALACMGSWNENYGDEKARLGQSFLHSLQAIRDDHRILCLGFVQSLFEGTMYVFVLEWTPALSRAVRSEQIPHGFIFASFMVSVMAGSAVFNLLCQRSQQPESFMRFVLLASALSLGTPILVPDWPLAIFLSFVLFELCVGIFWPAMGILRSKYLPEQCRSTTMNFFRVPLNMLVIGLLWQNLEMDTIFLFCVFFLLLAAMLQQILLSLSGLESGGTHPSYKLLPTNAEESAEKCGKMEAEIDVEGKFEPHQEQLRQTG